jgi:hypothetical protein
MFTSRRSFMRAGALFGIAAALPLNIFAQKGVQSPSGGLVTQEIPADHFEALANLTRDHFTKCLNSNFLLFTKQGGAADLKLAEINDLPFMGVGKLRKDEVGQGDGFTLVFSSKSHLRQDTYSLAHSYTGYFALLIVPAGKKGNTYYYSALINRLF